MLEVTQIVGEWMVVNQGDVYWVRSGEPGGSESDYAHPHVIIQDDVINRSRINTVVVCALTTNLRRAKAPGNVLLEAGEANLPRQSIVVDLKQRFQQDMRSAMRAGVFRDRCHGHIRRVRAVAEGAAPHCRVLPGSS